MGLSRILLPWDSQPQDLAPAVSAFGGCTLDHLWALNVAGQRRVLDSAGSADGVFGSGTGTSSGNQWTIGADGYYINYSDAGTGTANSKILNVGDPAGSGSPKNPNYFSVVARLQVATLAADTVIYGGASPTFTFRLTTAGALNIVKGGSGVVATSTGTLAANVEHDVGITWDGVEAKFYINGALDSTVAGAFTGFTSNVQYGLGAIGGIAGSNGTRMYRCAVFDGILPPSAFKELRSNGFFAHLFAPRSIPIPVTAAGGGGTTLVTQDAAHAHSAGNLALTLDTTLAIANASHAHAADNLALTTSVTLAIDSAAHAHAADNAVLSAASVLTVADAAHAHAADNLALTLDTTLAIDAAAHAHTAENITLSTAGSASLTVQDTAHAHAAENLALTLDTTLAVDAAAHAHAADNVALVTGSHLTIADAAHAHAAENVVLSTAATTNLVMQDAAHAHTADSLALTLDTTLAVGSAAHAHSANNVALTLEQWLAVADAWHIHTAQNVVLSIPGSALSDAEFRQMYDWLADLYGRQLLTVGTYIALK